MGAVREGVVPVEIAAVDCCDLVVQVGGIFSESVERTAEVIKGSVVCEQQAQ